KPPEPTSSQSFTQTETALLTISADFTTWQLISVGSRGPSWQNAHGRKSEAEAKERSLPKSMEQSSRPRKMLSAVHTINCCTKPAPLRLTQRISQLKTSTGRAVSLFTTVRNLDRTANQLA